MSLSEEEIEFLPYYEVMLARLKDCRFNLRVVLRSMAHELRTVSELSHFLDRTAIPEDRLAEFAPQMAIEIHRCIGNVSLPASMSKLEGSMLALIIQCNQAGLALERLIVSPGSPVDTSATDLGLTDQLLAVTGKCKLLQRQHSADADPDPVEPDDAGEGGVDDSRECDLMIPDGQEMACPSSCEGSLSCPGTWPTNS